MVVDASSTWKILRRISVCSDHKLSFLAKMHFVIWELNVARTFYLHVCTYL